MKKADATATSSEKRVGQAFTEAPASAICMKGPSQD